MRTLNSDAFKAYFIHLNRLALFLILSCLSFASTTSAQEGVGWGFWPAGSLGPFAGNFLCNNRGTIQVQAIDPGPFFLAGTDPVGFGANLLLEGMTAVPNGTGTQFVINYTYPVESVNFIIYDVDGAAGSWQDRIIINPTLLGAAQTANLSCPLGLGACTYTIAANQADATTTPSAFPNADGQLVVNIPGPIDALTINYQNHTVPVSTTQFIWMDPVIWSCPIVGVAKQMTRRAGQAFNVSPYLVDIDFNFENHGHVNLSNMTALEDLDATFNQAPHSANFVVNSITTLSGPVTFSENASFNGSADQELIAVGSSLLPGETASIRVTLNVNDYGSYSNAVTLNSSTPQLAITSDDSTDGTDPDGADADDNPDESSPSLLNTTTLPISLNYFSSHKDNHQLVIEWQTDIEFDHIGYKIYQQNPQGEKLALSAMIHKADTQLSQALKNYSFTMPFSSSEPIWLAEINTQGRTKWYGPFAVSSNHGKRINQAKIPWQPNQNHNTSNTNHSSLAIEVIKTGMHRIHYNDLLQSGLDLSNTQPIDIKISLGNKIIPVYINGNKDAFDSFSSFDFYAESIDSLYTNKRIYRLSTDKQDDLVIKQNLSFPTTVLEAWYWQTEHFNPDILYDFSSPTNDPWRAEKLATFAIQSKELEFPLDELYTNTEGSITLGINISGGINYVLPPEIYPSDPSRCGANQIDILLGIPNDHCLKLNINGTHLEDLVFDGLSVFKKNIELSPIYSETGIVKINLSLSGDTGYDHDIVHIEEISLKYPRNLHAIDDQLHFSIADSASFHNDIIHRDGFNSAFNTDIAPSISTNNAALLIHGFSQHNIVAYALNPDKPLKIKNTIIETNRNGFSVKIPAVASNDEYWISTENSLIKPVLSAWHESQFEASTATEYLIIAHPDFMQNSQQISSYHQNNGLQVQLVNLHDIYAEYSNSVIDPLAIKHFIGEMAKTNPLQYVLLIGSDNYDYKDYLSANHFSHIPSLYTAIDDVVRYTPSDSLFVDLNGDETPDLAIGRLPVRNNSELQLIIDKQMAFINQENRNQTIHFIADAKDSNNSFSQISNEISQLVPNTWSKLLSYRDDFNDAEATKSQILTHFTQNPRLTTYLGHSGPRNWFSFPSAFTYNDIGSLENNSAASIIIQWGCWNSYYVEPDANTMAHRFLFDSDNGAVAVFGASALTTVASEQAFAQLIIPEIFIPHQTIGQAMLFAKKSLQTRGSFKDIIIGWNLLGDPALKLY